MRVGNHAVRPDNVGWVVVTVKTKGDKTKDEDERGKEYDADPAYYSRFDQALRTLLDRCVKDEITPTTSLSEAVATVAHLYATIGDSKP